MNVLKDYLSEMSMICRSAAGVKETSYYGTLETLFKEVGKSLKPKVRCVINLANKGAGIPDGGLFTPNQFQKSSNDLIAGQLPERGAIEIKGTSDEVDLIGDSEQVAKYLKTYRQVLVTNYRDFLLIALDENLNPKKLERYSIADSDGAFWTKADHPDSLTDTENERFVEFLKRVMLYQAPIAKPEDVAWFLASYARDAKARIEQSELSALATIRKALEESLGIKFDGEKGEHFFRSTLVQTLFYGIFSAWVLWNKRSKSTPPGQEGWQPSSADGVVDLKNLNSGGDKDAGTFAEQTTPSGKPGHPSFTKEGSFGGFQWRTAVWELRVPMISVLFEQIATPSNLKHLNIVEVLDWTENVLNRVVRAEFFARFAEEHAVQYFYEPFLQAFDPQLRKELGVWYTPEEIVRYMVERVDRVLRTELNLPDGLADESVYVLDPACGTGAYLVEVLRRINQTLTEKGEDSIRGQKLKKAVMSRVFGFEILPAPFVVSHLQIGLLLEQLGVGFSDERNERAGVYLTNSLTGWDELPKKHLPYPEFEQERDAADKIKKESRILVILGNPPYNAFAGVAQTEEESVQIDVYKKGLVKEWGIKKFNLDDLYVRFFRLAERKIAEQTGQGIVCYISNFSYLSDPSFVVMRKKFLSEFDRVWIDNLNGDSRETGKTTPLGKPDPSIFSTEQTKVGIRVGTSIGLFVRRPDHVDGGMAEVGYREFWGTRKPEELLESLAASSGSEPGAVATGFLSASPLDVRKSSAFPDDLSLSGGSAAGRRHSLKEIGEPDGEAELHRSANGEAAESEPGAVATGFPALRTESKLDEETASPELVNRFSMRPGDVSDAYQSWLRLIDLSEIPPFNGPVERRGNSLIRMENDFDSLREYLDKNNSNVDVAHFEPRFMHSSGEFNATKGRELLLKSEVKFEIKRIAKYPFKPFDIRFAYLDAQIQPLFSRPSPELLKQAMPGNTFLISRDSADKSPEGSPFYFSSLICDYDSISGHARHFPLNYRPELIKSAKTNEAQHEMFGSTAEEIRANLSDSARACLQSLGFDNIDGDEETASLIWYHALAIGYSPEYLTENADGIRQDFPRIPLPANREDLIASEELGRRVAALLDTEKPVAGVTAGSVRAELRTVGVAAHVEGKQFQDDDFKVTARWGSRQGDGKIMPGKGKVETRKYTEREREAMGENPVATAPGSDLETLDIYLNDYAYWRNVPLRVWNYYIGGYQVIKKWLSYREFALLGRPLNLDEITEVTNMTRRIAALILMETELNANYQRIKANTHSFT